MSPLLDSSSDSGDGMASPDRIETAERGRPQVPPNPNHVPEREPNSSTSPVRRTPTSADIDAVIAAAMANAPPPPVPMDMMRDGMNRSTPPLMTNLLPAAVGADGRVNLFVGNLPYRVRWQDLKDLFRKAGTVLRADVSLGPDNRSRGYGTVLMGSREDGARAIDRFNGYAWQTRTLEVRPDRLPPEYEAQPHANHPPSRPPPFSYIPGGPPFPMPGQPNLGGVPWPGAPPGARPPIGYPGPPNGAPMYSNMMSNMGFMGSSPLSGTSPLPSSISPQSIYGSNGLPLPAQNGFNIVASPLAGSLTAGSGTPASIDQSTLSRDISNHYAPGLTHQNSGPSMARSISPNGILGLQGSRPTSSNGRRNSKPSPTKPEGLSDHQGYSSRAPPPGHLGPLPPSVFAGVKAVPGESRRSVDLGDNSPGPQFGGLGLPPPPQPFGMAPLAPGTDLGEPSTLRDRIVFVSNLPLIMQWHELRDLLRPAGAIIRADVATGPDGRPRGFGTVLFATEPDAALAVAMFNDREIGGQKIRVHLDLNRPQPGDRNDPPVTTGLRLRDPSWAQPTIRPRHPSDPMNFGSFSNISSGSNSPVPSRLPWPLNTTDNGSSTPSRQISNGSNPDLERAGRHSHHPGPISMPPFPSLNGNNPLSPLQTRGLPPMTPSMPGFVFHAFPSTPPINAHYLSPGLDPFSPGAPVTSPGMFSYNPFLNAAPGAPINRSPQGGSAALDTPTTQTFPGNPVHGYGTAVGPPGGGLPPSQQQQQQNGGEEYFPVTSPPSNIASSPLNAKVRLASTAPENKLEELTRVLTLSDNGRQSPSPTHKKVLQLGPNSTSPNRFQAQSNGNGMKKSTSGLEISDLKNGNVNDQNVHGNGDTPSFPQGVSTSSGRISLDNPRPNLGVWGNGLFANGTGTNGITGERRASWGDA